MLKVFVFDDTDPEEASYLGMASIPLITLAHNKAIKGTFELKQIDGAINGTIDVELRWQFSYIAPQRPTILSQVRTSSMTCLVFSILLLNLRGTINIYKPIIII